MSSPNSAAKTTLHQSIDKVLQPPRTPRPLKPPLAKQLLREQSRLKPLPPLSFPEQLPVSARREEIARAIAEHPVVIVCGETGSGKTTQLPKIAALAGCGQRGLMGHTQPRRIAAQSVAKRIAEELGSPLGEHVGYKVRFNEALQPGASIKLMTDGILLAETMSDPQLRAYDCIIIDEAHERSLNIDFLLGYVKRLLLGARRHDLKVIVTSATIDAQRFAQHFALDGKAAPVIEVSGRVYPVDVLYRPAQAESKQPDNAERNGDRRNARSAERSEERDLSEQIEDAIDELWRLGSGDVLVFLPGEREIRDAADHLRRAFQLGTSSRLSSNPPSGRLGGPVDILPLYSRLSSGEQQKIFSPGNGRRVILATNVAETSLTVPGIRYVVDTGLARMKRYLFRAKVESLLIEPISQASANQRSGRCGRVSDGVCIRLYSEEDFLKRPKFTEPELLRSSLAAVILRMKALRLGEVSDFPFVEAPQRRAIVDGLALLDELHALEADGTLSAIGREMARLPLDPKVSRMLIAARALHCLPEVVVIASAMAAQDPRDRPMDRQAAADEKHRRFRDERGDFLSFLKLWDYWKKLQREKESHNKLAAKLGQEFLSVRKLREWYDVHSQLEQAVKDLGWLERHQKDRHSVQTKTPPAAMQDPQPEARVDARDDAQQDAQQDAQEDEDLDPKKAEAIFKALLTGLLGNLGTKSPEDTQYQGTHQVKFVIHPSSALTKKQPKWLMAGEMVDTGRLYARNVARIDPVWIEQAGEHLIKRNWSEPSWSKNSGQVVAFESGMLYGLNIYAQRRVPYADKEPLLARELLIKQALVEGDWLAGQAAKHLPFIEHNRQLVAQIRKLEDKIRRPDVLVDEDTLYEWFDSQLPESITSGKRLEDWYRTASKNTPELLKLSKAVLMRKGSEGIETERFPKRLSMRSSEFALDYKFDPGSENDGVTMTVPITLLNQVDANACEWLVPGLLQDKAEALLKSLPQRHRRHMVPLKNFAADFCNALRQSQEPVEESEGLTSTDANPLSLSDQLKQFRRGSLVDGLIAYIKERLQTRLLNSDFKLETIPAHLLMNFKLVDATGRYLAQSRVLAQLKADFGPMAQASFQKAQNEAGAALSFGAPLLAALNQNGFSPPAMNRASVGPTVRTNSFENSPARTADKSLGNISAKPSNVTASAIKNIEGSQRYVDWSFGELPELMELEVMSPIGKQTAVGFPALKDLGDACELAVFDDEQMARRIHQQGLRRLFMIALKEPIKFFERNIPELLSMGLAFGQIGTQEELKNQIVMGMIDRACLKQEWPRRKENFDGAILQARARLNLVGQELARSAAAILSQWQLTQKKLGAMRAQLPKEVLADIDAQLAGLVFKQFLTQLPDAQLKHIPRFLEAVVVRLDKWRQDPAKDASLMRDLAPLMNQHRRLVHELRDQEDARVQDMRWLLEELRVSLFAQQLRTAMPVSVKRLQKALAGMAY